MDEMMLEYNQCEEAVKRLNDYLSRELAAEETERFRKHLAKYRSRV